MTPVEELVKPSICFHCSQNMSYFSLLFQVSDTLVVSGCEGGKVKVWDIERACLLKVRTSF